MFGGDPYKLVQDTSSQIGESVEDHNLTRGLFDVYHPACFTVHQLVSQSVLDALPLKRRVQC